MSKQNLIRLSVARKALLAAMGAAAISVPLVIGILRAQTLPPPPAFRYDVASVRPSSDPAGSNSGFSPGPQGGIRTRNTTAMKLLTFAYDVRKYQVHGAPGWADSDLFDVSFTPDKEEPRLGPEATPNQLEGAWNRNRQRLRAVLQDRFGLVMKAETRELPVYALVVAKKTSNRLTEASTTSRPRLISNRGAITATSVAMPMLAVMLSEYLSRPVIDETGMAGGYDFNLTFTPDASVQLPRKDGQTGEPPAAVDNGGPTIFTALTEQLGLRLESKKGPVQVFVIEKIEKPSEN